MALLLKLLLSEAVDNVSGDNRSEVFWRTCCRRRGCVKWRGRPSSCAERCRHRRLRLQLSRSTCLSCSRIKSSYAKLSGYTSNPKVLANGVLLWVISQAAMNLSHLVSYLDDAHCTLLRALAAVARGPAEATDNEHQHRISSGLMLLQHKLCNTAQT